MLLALLSNLPVAGANAEHEEAIVASAVATKKLRNIILSWFRKCDSTTMRARERPTPKRAVLQ
jgi:hypothetical protein